MFAPRFSQAITGSQLLKLDKHTLSSFGILSEFRQETILDAIEILRKNDFSVPRNLYEFMVSTLVCVCVCVCVSAVCILLVSIIDTGSSQEAHIHHCNTLQTMASFCLLLHLHILL